MYTLPKNRPFTSKELITCGNLPPGRGTAPGNPAFSTPISYRDNALSLFWDKKPCWAVTSGDFLGIACNPYNEHMGRTKADRTDLIDCFGARWEFVPEVGGSIVHGGNPRFTDANDWKNVIEMPDVDSWDWEGGYKDIVGDPRYAMNVTTTNGFGFERLISFMDFVNAAMAVIDEDQADALKELVDALYDMGIAMCAKVFEFFPFIDGITFHDDWGTQKDPFFSDEAARTFFLPGMKKFCDFIHANGRYTEIHSCGHTESRVNIFVEAGIDTWQMQILNDYDKLYKEWGDKIVIQIPVDEFGFDPKDDEQARQCARQYVDNYCQPGKPSIVSGRGMCMNQAFMEELYEYSRKHYLAQ